MPEQMSAWVEAHGNTCRYGNVSEYVRDLVRRDQERRETAVVELRALLERAEASTVIDHAFTDILKAPVSPGGPTKGFAAYYPAPSGIRMARKQNWRKATELWLRHRSVHSHLRGTTDRKVINETAVVQSLGFGCRQYH